MTNVFYFLRVLTDDDDDDDILNGGTGLWCCLFLLAQICGTVCSASYSVLCLIVKKDFKNLQITERE